MTTPLWGNLLSVDPGSKSVGAALWTSDGVLMQACYLSFEPRCTLTRNLREWCKRGDLEAIVIERPQVYRERHLKGDPNDLIDIAFTCGAIEAEFCQETIYYRPSQWKGQTPKEIHNERTRSKLSHEELSRVEFPTAKSLSHNVVDAIGLGLYHLGKIGVR